MHKIQQNCGFAYILLVSPIISLIFVSLGRPGAPRKGTRGAQGAMMDPSHMPSGSGPWALHGKVNTMSVVIISD